MGTIGIYKIISPSGRVYIGQSWNIENRHRHYKYADCKGQHLLRWSIKKYGALAHEYVILVSFNEGSASQELLDKVEDFYILLYKNSGVRLLNLKGGGSSGKLSEKIKSKISKSMTGENNPMFGRRKEYHHFYGKRGSQVPWFGSKRSPEQIERYRLNNLGEKNPMFGVTGERHHNFGKTGYLCVSSKKVIDTENGVVFNSIKEAAESKGVNYRTLSGYLKGERPNKTKFAYLKT